MVCLSNLAELNFIPLSEWDFPDLIPGFIPILWTTGSYDPLAQNGNPWYGLVVPDKFSWYGSTAEIKYFSGAMQYGGCYVSFPPTRIRISFSCSCGVHQVYIEVTSGTRRFERRLFNIPGHWILYNSNVRFGSNTPICAEKYFPKGTVLEIDARVLVTWIQLVREFSVDSSGVAPVWFQYILDNIEDDNIGIQSICNGCEYGQLPQWGELSVDFLSTIIEQELKTGGQLVTGFPVTEQSFNQLLKLCVQKCLMVIKPDLSYDIYRELELECGKYDTVLLRGSGLLSFECVIDDTPPEPTTLPGDDDPRWKPNFPPLDTCYREYYDSYANQNPLRKKYDIGSYDGHIPVVSLPSSMVPYVEYSDFYTAPNGNPNAYYKQHITRSFQVIKYRTKNEPADNSVGYVTKLTTEVVDYEMDYGLDTRHGSAVFWAMNDAAIAKLQAFNAAMAEYKSSPAGCDAEFNFDNGGYPPKKPPMDRPEEKRLNLDGKCFVKGVVMIGIKYNVEFTRVLRELGPEVQEWAIKKTLPLFIPTAIRIPFRFQLPQGTAPFFGTTLNMTGTFIQVGIGPESIVINLEEIFAYYNFASNSGILSLIIPGPVSIDDLESFCED